MSPFRRADDGWAAAIAIAGVADRIARLEDARGILHAAAQALDAGSAQTARRGASVFSDYAHDAAAAFGRRDAAADVCVVLDALIEGIKIIDDIQDEEADCLATRIGEERALAAAYAALAHGLDRAAALPLPEDAWRAALAAIARGIRQTAIGQQLEQVLKVKAAADFDSFWSVVDHKTPPLVATALELGALAAGAAPAQAAALTRLAVPFGRLLQISDDCNDALGEHATDWRTPHLNLLMLFSLSGPNGAELATLLRRETLREAQLWLLRDGALAYALHAQTTTLAALSATLDSLDLPNPEPFVQTMQRRKQEAETLLAKMSLPS
ncbi:MAG TPA: polyprenyl synthetase family protein [Thermoanaerobaculia bacterium]